LAVKFAKIVNMTFYKSFGTNLKRYHETQNFMLILIETISPVNIKSELGDFVSYVSLNIVGALKEKNSLVNLL
jgi:hypothetical protein